MKSTVMDFFASFILSNLIVGIAIGIYGSIVEKNGRILWCVLFAEGMYSVLVHL